MQNLSGGRGAALLRPGLPHPRAALTTLARTPRLRALFDLRERR